MENYARKNGFSNIRHFTDDGIRGTTFRRPGLDAMLDEIRAGNVATNGFDIMSIFRDVINEWYAEQYGYSNKYFFS